MNTLLRRPNQENYLAFYFRHVYKADEAGVKKHYAHAGRKAKTK